MMKPYWTWLATVMVCSMVASVSRAQVPSTKVMLDFEDDADFQAIAQGAEDLTCLPNQDYATSGKRSCQMIVSKGKFGVFYLRGDKVKDCDKYDYFAMDIEVPGDDRSRLNVELWDALSKNYATRCTLDTDVVPGRQTVLLPINRAKRNSKEGISWDEAAPADKIDRAHLKYIKVFVGAPKDHDLIWRVDNVRLLTEDALGLSLDLKLPEGAMACRFGKSKPMPGFTNVAAGQKFDGQRGFTLPADIENCGKHWPDPLTGDGVYSPKGRLFRFEMAVPDGDYQVWVAAGQVLKGDAVGQNFLLSVNDKPLFDAQPAVAAFNSEKYLFRFMNTLYSARPHAQWLDYVIRMYPVWQVPVTVEGGRLSIKAQGFQLSSVIVVPSKNGPAAFDQLCKTIEQERIRLFEATQKPFALKPQEKTAGEDACVWFIPDDVASVTPFTGPTAAARSRKSYDLEAAPGQNLIFRLGVQTFADLGKITVSLDPLQGPGVIPPGDTQWFLQNFARRGVDLVETALLPRNDAPAEQGLTRCFWAWMKVPADAKAGTYQGTLRLTLARGSEVRIPMTLRVLPITLAADIPYSFGMWYGPTPTADPAQNRRVIKEQLEFMHAIGFTGVCLPGPDADGKVDPFLWNLAKEVGFGRLPQQMSQTSSLGMGRAIGRQQLGLGHTVDTQPGSELRHPQFHQAFVASAREFAKYIQSEGLPVAVQTVDEPREQPNPWNRNLADTDLYGDYLAEAGVRNRYCDPMGDSNGEKDYTPLIDHHDIIATHAGKFSEKLMTLTPAKGKALWIYNIGMDRLGWGFYNWRAGSTGRWEWHFRSGEAPAAEGYLNDEWYNPFTAQEGYAPLAPYATCKGAMLFKSVYLTTADGITDTAYLTTLEAALTAAKAKAVKEAVVTKADGFLKRLHDEIPFLPDVEGMDSASSGALVGQGIRTPAAAHCEDWRREAGGLIAALQQ